MSKIIFQTLDSDTNDAQLTTLKKILELLHGDFGADGGGGGIIINPNPPPPLSANVKPAIAVQVQLAGAPQVSLAGVARYPNGAPTLFVTAIIWAYATNKQPILLAPFNAGVADSNMQPVLPNQYFSLDNTGRIGDLADHGVKSSDAYSVVTYYWYPV